MACILKIPTTETKGVVTFTTQDRDKFILDDEELQSKILLLKEKWVFGLHHNWHDFKFDYNPIFDFSMAGETDLIEKNGKEVPLVPLDACNFSPSYFTYSKNEKFWDILYVGRAVYFKKIPEFFKIIRNLYDKGLMYRVLLVSPIPSDCDNGSSSSTSFCSIRDEYDKMFNAKERNLFTLLTTNYKDAFPFDIPTLSQFYKLSKVFVHSADNERRCRVAGYAWACGMPVVSMDCVASLLPKVKQKKPFVYIAKDYNDFIPLIEEAVTFVNSGQYNKNIMLDAIEETSEQYTINQLKKELANYCNGISDDSTYIFDNLDIRLGRHHGQGENTNSIGWSIDTLLNYLGQRDIQEIEKDTLNKDLERYITILNVYGEFKEESLYKKENKLTFRNVLIYFYEKYEFIRKLRKFMQGK